MTGRRGIALSSGAGVAVAVALAVVSVAEAGIVNGDFQADPPLSGWMSASVGDASVEAATDLGNTLAYLHAQATYTWQEGQWVGTLGAVQLYQIGIVIEAGKSTLSFDAAAAISGQENELPMVAVTVAGVPAGMQSIPDSGMTNYRVDLTDADGDPLPGGTVADLVVRVNAVAPYSEGTYEGQQVTQVVGLNVDNFQLVPLPAPAAIVMVGTVALLRRRR